MRPGPGLPEEKPEEAISEGCKLVALETQGLKGAWREAGAYVSGLDSLRRTESLLVKAQPQLQLRPQATGDARTMPTSEGCCRHGVKPD